jgi:hypothetical protein
MFCAVAIITDSNELSCAKLPPHALWGADRLGEDPFTRPELVRTWPNEPNRTEPNRTEPQGSSTLNRSTLFD